MKTFVLLTKLPAGTSGTISDRKLLGRDWLEQVKEKCPEVKVYISLRNTRLL